MATAAAAGEVHAMAGEGGWYGVRDLATALHLAEHGWHEPVASIVSQSTSLLAKQTRSLIPVLNYCDEPGEPDVSSYLEGEDECFLITSEGMNDTPVVGRAVKIILEPCVSAGTSSEALMRRGAMVAAVAHPLEQSGVQTAIEFRSLVANHAMDCHLEVVLKEFGQPFDIRGLAFWLVHNAASRVFTFAGAFAGTGYTYAEKRTVGWANRNPPFEANVAGFTRHTTFEHGGALEIWATAALKMAGIEIGE